MKPGENFIYWHVNYDGPAKMNFVRQEKIFGLRVYQYETSYENVVIDQTKELSHIDGVGQDRGIEVEPRLKIWVEPRTGYLVKYEDDSRAYFYDLNTRERQNPWNAFRNKYTESSIAEHASEAAYQRQISIIFEIVLPLGLGILAVISFVVWCILRNKAVPVHEHFDLGKKQRKIFILLILLFTVCAVLIARNFFTNAANEYAKADFETRIAEINDNIIDQFNIQSNVLRGARGLFDASEKVTDGEWKKFVDSLDLKNNFPGISTLRYAQAVPKSELSLYEAEIKSVYGEEHEIWPKVENEHFIVTLYEPRSPAGDRILGFDIMSDEARAAAAEKAISSGELTLSGRVPAIFEEDLDPSARILIYLPVYKKGMPHDTSEERRESIQGLVYSGLRMKSFMEDIYTVRNGIINIEIFATKNEDILTDDNILYSSDSEYEYGVSYKSKFTRLAKLEVGGQTWVIRYSSTPEFGLDFSHRFFPPILIVIGVLFYLMIVFLLHRLFIQKNRAMEVIAEDQKEIEKMRNKLGK